MTKLSAASAAGIPPAAPYPAPCSGTGAPPSIPFCPSVKATHVSGPAGSRSLVSAQADAAAPAETEPSPAEEGVATSACLRLRSGRSPGSRSRVLSSPLTALAQHAVVESQADDGLLVAAVFPLDLSRLHTPQSGQVVRGGWNRKWTEKRDVPPYPLRCINLKGLLSLLSGERWGLVTGSCAEPTALGWVRFPLSRREVTVTARLFWRDCQHSPREQTTGVKSIPPVSREAPLQRRQGGSWQRVLQAQGWVLTPRPRWSMGVWLCRSQRYSLVLG